MGLTIETVQPIGADQVTITARDENGIEYTATGWLSALTNHYGPESYDVAGHFIGGAKSRARTPEEVGDYALERILAENPQLAAPAPADEPAPIVFVTPAEAAEVVVPEPEPVS